MRSEGPRWSRPEELVRWHYGRGRERLGGLRAIEPGAPRGRQRDWTVLEDLHALYALTTRCIAEVVDDRQAGVLRLAYQPHARGVGLSDPAIAERLGVGATTVRMLRRRALRTVEEEGRRWGLIA